MGGAACREMIIAQARRAFQAGETSGFFAGEGNPPPQARRVKTSRHSRAAAVYVENSQAFSAA